MQTVNKQHLVLFSMSASRDGAYAAITFAQLDHSRRLRLLSYGMRSVDAMELFAELQKAKSEFKLRQLALPAGTVLGDSPPWKPVGFPTIASRDRGKSFHLTFRKMDSKGIVAGQDGTVLMDASEAMQILSWIDALRQKFNWPDAIIEPQPRPEVHRLKLPDVHHPSPGKCIYCGSTFGLTDEHLIPHSLGGNHVLDKSSCEKCSDITKRFEGYCTREIFGPLRFYMKYPSRKKRREWPKTLPLWLEFAHHSERRDIPIADYPGVMFPLPEFEPPDLAMGKPPNLAWRNTRIAWCMEEFPDDRARLRKLLNSTGARQYHAEAAPFKYGPFAQLVAKIAHGWAVIDFGLDSFEPLLPPYILGQKETFSYVVGSMSREDAPDFQLKAHQSDRWPFLIRNGKDCYASMVVTLFGFSNLRPYWVVVGRASDRLIAAADSPSAQYPWRAFGTDWRAEEPRNKKAPARP